MAEPAPELKAVQAFLLEEIWAQFEAHPAAHDSSGHSALTNASAHVGAAWLLKLDVRGFFPSITAHRVAAFLTGQGACPEVARALALLATAPTENGFTLPQGAPTSNAIATALCRSLDSRLAGLAAKHRALAYTRYVDDLTFSWRGDVPAAFALNATRILRAEGFRSRPDKTRLLRTPALVTGYVVGADSVRVSRRVRRRLRAAEHNLVTGNGDLDSVLGLRSIVTHRKDRS
jgi:hypothetical protein